MSASPVLALRAAAGATAVAVLARRMLLLSPPPVGLIAPAAVARARGAVLAVLGGSRGVAAAVAAAESLRISFIVSCCWWRAAPLAARGLRTRPRRAADVDDDADRGATPRCAEAGTSPSGGDAARRSRPRGVEAATSISVERGYESISSAIPYPYVAVGRLRMSEQIVAGMAVDGQSIPGRIPTKA